jgi:hypothetical protein
MRTVHFPRSSVFTLSLVAAGVALLVSTGAVSAAKGGSGGVSREPAFYVDGVTYRTVATPTDLFNTGGPDHSFDTIFDFGGLQLNVATAAPGDGDYNGGRWRVHALQFTNYQGALANTAVDMNGNDVLDSDEEVAAAISAGYASDAGVVKSFVCPVIKFPQGGS